MTFMESIIDDINRSVDESELAVIESFIAVCDKSVCIMENFSGDDINDFSIIMESKDESVITKILSFIQRLIASLFNSIRNLISGKNKEKSQTTVPDVISKEYKNSVKNKLLTAGTVGAQAVLVFSAAGLGVMGFEKGQEIVTENINSLKTKIHEKKEGEDSLSSIIRQYKYTTETIPKTTGDINKYINTTISENGEVTTVTFDIGHFFKMTKDCFEKFISLCGGNGDSHKLFSIKAVLNNKAGIEKKDFKGYEYEKFLNRTIGYIFNESKIGGIWCSLIHKETYKPSTLNREIDEIIEYFSSSTFEERLTRSVKTLINDLDEAGKSMPIIKETKNNEYEVLHNKDVRTDYSNKLLKNYLINMIKFVKDILFDVVSFFNVLKSACELQYQAIEKKLSSTDSKVKPDDNEDKENSDTDKANNDSGK